MHCREAFHTRPLGDHQHPGYCDAGVANVATDYGEHKQTRRTSLNRVVARTDMDSTEVGQYLVLSKQQEKRQR